MAPLPSYPANDLFATDFHPHWALPGFFPGAGGFFHGHPDPNKRFLFFGTDFGPLSYQRSLPSTGGEPEGVVTLRQLRSIVAQSGLRPNHRFLTNALLCMRRVSPPQASSRSGASIDDVLACAAWHRQEIASCRPAGVALMGAASTGSLRELCSGVGKLLAWAQDTCRRLRSRTRGGHAGRRHASSAHAASIVLARISC